MDKTENILITGADGFLGSHLTDFLIEKDYSLYCLKVPNHPVENLTHYTDGKPNFTKHEMEDFLGKKIEIPTNNNLIKIIECNIKNGGLLEKIFKHVKPKYIFHFAAQPYVIPSWEDPINTIEVNAIGTINVFEALKKNHIESRVIVACSSAEYGTTTKKNRALTEEDRLLAVHPYGISKIATELLARQYFINFGIEAVNLRFFNQTGPRKINDACSDFVRQVAQIDLGLQEPKIRVGNLSPYRDIMGIKDSIRAIWLATKKGQAGETYNVCSGRKIKIRDVLETALSFSKKNIEVQENTPEKLRNTDEDIILGDNTKIKKLGFEITQSLEELLREMYNYWIESYKKEI